MTSSWPSSVRPIDGEAGCRGHVLGSPRDSKHLQTPVPAPTERVR